MSKSFAVSVTIGAVDRVTKTLNQITKNVSQNQNKLMALTPGIQGPKRLQDSLRDLSWEWGAIKSSKKVSGFFSDIQSGSEAATRSVGAFSNIFKDTLKLATGAGLAAGGIGFAASRLVGETTTKSNNLARAAAALDIPQAKLRAYRLAGESVGVSAPQIDSILARINRVSTEFRNNNINSARPFLALDGGFKLLDQSLKQRPATDILDEFLKKINARGIRQLTKVDLTEKALGDSSAMPLIGLGALGIGSRVKRFSNLSESEIEAATKNTRNYLEASTQFKSAMERLENVAARTILPGFTQGLEKLSGWLSQNEPMITRFLDRLGEALPTEMTRAIQALGALATALSFISDRFGIINTLLIGFTASTLVNLVSGFINLAGALKGILALFRLGALFSPISLGIAGAIAGITALIGLLYTFRQELYDIGLKSLEFFKHLFEPLFGWVEKAFHYLGSFSAPPVYAPLDHEKLKKGPLMDRIINIKDSRKQEKQSAEIAIRFQNPPPGMSAEQTKGTLDVALLGYQLQGVVS